MPRHVSERRALVRYLASRGMRYDSVGCQSPREPPPSEKQDPRGEIIPLQPQRAQRKAREGDVPKRMLLCTHRGVFSKKTPSAVEVRTSVQRAHARGSVPAGYCAPRKSVAGEARWSNESSVDTRRFFESSERSGFNLRNLPAPALRCVSSLASFLDRVHTAYGQNALSTHR